MIDTKSLPRGFAAGALIVLSLGAAGCAGEDAPARPVTWHEDVAAIVHHRCTSCHVAGGIAPFGLDQYTSAKATAASMVDAIEQGRMPPWGAQETDECKPRFGFKDDLRVPASELETLRSWLSDGTLEGDPAKAAPLPEPPSLSVKDPSLDLSFPGDYTVDGTTDDFQCFVLDPGVTETRWVSEIQLTPGNRTVDHHGLIFLDLNGASEALATNGRFPCFTNPDVENYLMAAWAPGAAPVVMPPGAGMPVYPGSRIVVQMHYHPTGKGPEKDRSSVQLKWLDGAPQYEGAQALVGNNSKQRSDGTGLQPGPNDAAAAEFRIPANAVGHTETMIYTQDIPLAIPIFSVGTHMHYVGTDMKIELTQTFGEEGTQCLLQTPAWDFNWQRIYQYDAAYEDLPRIGAGDSLTMRCTYNNSMSNPFVAKALKERGLAGPTDVLLGEETLDEMCLGVFGILVAPGTLQEIFK